MARNYLGYYSKRFDAIMETIEELDDVCLNPTPWDTEQSIECRIGTLLRKVDKAKFYNRKAWSNCEITRDEYIENIEIINYINTKYEKRYINYGVESEQRI